MRTPRVKPIFALLLATCLGSLSACDGIFPPIPGTGSGGSGAAPPDPDGVLEVVSSSRDRLPRQELDQERRDAIRHGNLDLSFDILANHEKNSENMAVSALSLRSAFGMVYAMAKGETRDEIATALGMDQDPKVTLAALNNTDLALRSRNLPPSFLEDPVVFSTANGVFMRSGKNLAPKFLDDLAQYFGSPVYLGDFKSNSQSILKSINGWVKARTNGLVSELLTSDEVHAQTDWVLVNALYFKAPWSRGNATKGRLDFTTLTGETKEVDALSMDRLQTVYGTQEGFQWVKIPLRGQMLSLMLIVPDEGKFEQVRGELSGARIDQMLNDQRSGIANVSYPMFKVESKRVSLVDYLKNRGMSAAFTPAFADFSGALEGEGTVDPVGEVLQTCVVAVDEKGVEAAAAAAVGSQPPSDPEIDFRLKVDRPFLFAIMDGPTGYALFSGQVLDPE